MNDEKKNFFRLMLIYGGIFLAVTAALLLFFAFYLSAFEASRPNTVAQRTVSAMEPEEIRELSESTVATLNHELMSEEDCYAYIGKLLTGAQTVRSGGGDGGRIRYALRADGLTLGTLLLTPKGSGIFGFEEYSAELSDIDLAPLCGQTRVSAPPDWTVLCDGKPLGAKYIADRQTHYRLLEEFYGGDDALPLPVLYTYDTGRYLVEPELEFRDADGKTVDDPQEEDFLAKCPAADITGVSGVSEEFVKAYIEYASNVNNNITGNYYRLERIMVQDSTILKRIRYAIAGLGWASSRGEELRGIDFGRFAELGGGYYYCDLVFTVDTLGTKDVVTTKNGVKIIFLKAEDGSFLINALSSF